MLNVSRPRFKITNTVMLADLKDVLALVWLLNGLTEKKRGSPVLRLRLFRLLESSKQDFDREVRKAIGLPPGTPFKLEMDVCDGGVFVIPEEVSWRRS